MSHPSIVHRALVTYSNERTGEIRVKIPAVIGQSEVYISKVGRSATNGIWTVPAVGETIVVSADDEMMTNVVWVHTDAWSHSSHQRNYFQALNTGSLSPSASSYATVSYNQVAFSSGITLESGTKIKFEYAGTYNLQFSIQWYNDNSHITDTIVWLAYNNADYAQSATYTAVPAKHGAVPGYMVTAVNILGQAVGNGDYVELRWAANNTVLMNTIASPTPGAFPGAFPYAAPSSPAVIVTVTQVA